MTTTTRTDRVSRRSEDRVDLEHLAGPLVVEHAFEGDRREAVLGEERDDVLEERTRVVSRS
jgi:hypothetical protein